jgi:hypothetical protein
MTAVRYTNLDKNFEPYLADDGNHPFVRVERTIAGALISQIVATRMTPKDLPWKASVKAANEHVIEGHAMRTPSPEEAFLWCDRSQSPCLPIKHFPDAAEHWWTWTDAPSASSPSDGAWHVFLGYGGSSRGHQGDRGRVRAVVASQ